LRVEHASQRFPLLNRKKFLPPPFSVLWAFHREDGEDQACIPNSRTTTMLGEGGVLGKIVLLPNG
jgi:hypothetical protein